MFNCRKLSPSRWPTTDISFYKKRSDSRSRDSSDKIAPEYTKKPSTQAAKDPRNQSSLPRLQSRCTFDPVLLSTRNWCAREPSKTLLLEGVCGVKSEASLLAQLEELLQDSQLQVKRIELAAEGQLASVEFVSGFAAWETLRRLVKVKHFKRVSADEDSKLFKQLLKRKEEDFNRDHDRHRPIPSQPRPRRDYHQPPTNELSCNPFVPCLKVGFEDYDRLGFSRRLDPKMIISSIFKGKIASFSNVEEGTGSWHIHFGREIDVIEADRLFLSETFEFEGRSFYFQRWKLVKDGKPWRVPSTDRTEPPLKSSERAESSWIQSSPIPVPFEDDMAQVISSLPKFVRKRPAEREDVEACGVKTEAIRVEACGVKTEAISVEAETIKVRIEAEESKKVKVEAIKTDPEAPQSALDSIASHTSTQPAPATKRARKTKKENKEADIDVGEEAPLFEQLLPSGCARTEGFFALPAATKKRVKFPGILEAFSTASSAASASDSSRSSRVQNRRPLPSANLDLFRVSPLQSATKFVALRNSSIHSYGLVILEAAEPGELIIEYVGELVRASVANIRERHYEQEHRGDGIASSYLFRLDDVMVIDATKKGSLARFINHSCDPNCVAKTITLNGSKRIVMYAKKPLRPGDELTYDYKFPLEKNPEKRVKCLCGSNICRKFLN